jgi:hypothetical protein
MITTKRWGCTTFRGNTVDGLLQAFETQGRFTPCAPVEWLHEVANSDCAPIESRSFQTRLGSFLEDSEMNEAEFRLFSEVLAGPASTVSGKPLPEYPG